LKQKIKYIIVFFYPEYICVEELNTLLMVVTAVDNS